MNLSNGIYTFRNVAYPNKMLNLYYDERNNILANGQNVILYQHDESLEQQWRYSDSKLLTMRNNSYALDRYMVNGQYLYNADVWNVNAYSQDQILQVIIQNDNVPNGIEADGVVVIQLSDGCMNLTAVSNQNGSNSGKTSTSGGNVYWAQQSSTITNAQKWYYKQIVPVQAVMMDRSTLSLFVGESDWLYAYVLPYNASNQTLEWESSNENVATVTKAGFVTAVGVGTTQIKAKAKDGSGKYGTCTLTVTGYVPVTDVSLNKNQITIEKGDSSSLVATVSPSNATYKAVIWESSNTNVAKVTGGKVTALSKGTATITAKSTDNSNYRDTCTVTVTDTTTGNDTETDTDTGDVNDVKVTSITIEYENDEVTVGENFFVHKTVCPQNATNKEVTWSSSNTTVATVNPESGFVYAKNAGSTIITATACDGSDTKGSFRLTVNAADIKVSSIKLNEYNICLEKGKTKELVATPLPSNAANKAVSWTSCEPCVATVDANGNVEAVGVGTTTITATAKDGSGKSATCTVQVTENILVESVRVSPSTKTMTVGQSEYLYEIVCPTNATNKCVKWTSDNTNVVTVNYESGLMFAQGVGTAKIRATAQDGSKKYGEATVYVQPPKAVTGIELCSCNVTMNVGDTMPLEATIFPCDATNQSVIWCSSNENVATVGMRSGIVSAHMAGTTTITATTVDGEYQASCTVTVWYCGGSNYKDVTNHTMVLQSDGYYVCVKCGYRVKSPHLQDESILDEEDYYIVEGCYEALPYYIKLEEKQLPEEKMFTNTLFAKIDDIRSLEKYKHKYDFCDSSNNYKREYTTENQNDWFNIMPTYNKYDINSFNILIHNGMAEGLINLLVGFFIPPTYADLFTAITTENECDVLTQFLSDLAQKGGYKEIGIILNLINMGASANQEMKIGDKLVKICFQIGAGVYVSDILFSEDGQIKTISHSVK